MILQRLAEHFDRIEKEMPPPGFSLQKISFCVVLEPDGRLNLFQSLQQQEGRRLVATQMFVPGQSKPVSRQNSIGLCFHSLPASTSRAIQAALNR